MGSIRIVQNTFVGGELSPAAWGRHDIAAYFKGAAMLDNFMVLKTGGVRKRYGIRATDEGVGSYLPADGSFKLIPYRYDRSTCCVLLLYTPLSGNSVIRLIDKSLDWTADPYGAMELAFRIEPQNMAAVRHRQVGDTVFICCGTSAPVQKILINKELHSDAASPFTGLSAANANAPLKTFYTEPEWDYDYCPLGLSTREVYYDWWSPSGDIAGTPGWNRMYDCHYVRVNQWKITGASGTPFKYLAVPVMSDGHEIFSETAALESRMETSLYLLPGIYNGGVDEWLKYGLEIFVSFYTDRLPSAVKIYRSDQGNYANLRLLATVQRSAWSQIGTSTLNGRAVTTFLITEDPLTSVSSDLISLGRAANGFERTASYYAVGTSGQTVSGGTDLSRVSVAHVGNANMPSAARGIALSVSCVKNSTPDTIDVYRALLDLGGTGTAIKIASINTVAGTVTNAAGTSAIVPADSQDGLTRTYLLTDTGTHITNGGAYPLTSGGFAWTNYNAAASEVKTSLKPAAPAGLATTVSGMSGSYVKKYSCQGVTGGVWSDMVNATASIATAWTAGAYVTLTATFPATRGYDRVVFGKMSAGIYGEIASVYPGDAGWSEANGTVTATVTDDNVTPSDAIYSQTNILAESGEQQATLYGSDIDIIQQRIAVSGGNGIPFSLQYSAVGDLYNFWASRPAQQDEAFQITLSVTTPSDIRHSLAFRNYLLCFSDGGVYRVQGGSEGLSFASANTDRISEIGCAPAVPPIETISGILFAASDLRTVFELRYDLSQDSVVPVERSVLANHLTQGKTIVCMAHQRFPESIVWCVLSDGSMAGFTYQAENEVYAWHRHSVPHAQVIGAVATDTVTDGMADGEGASDILFAVRGANGKVRLCVFSADRADTAAGADLEGTSKNANVVATLTTLRPELPDRNVQGIPKNITDCLIRVRDTEKLSVRSASGENDEVTSEREPGQTYTGNVKLMPRGAINDDGQMTIVSDRGPCEIQCVVWKTEF